jgi:plasmid replication initiation protein
MKDHISKKRNYNLKTLRHRKHKEIEYFIADEKAINSFRDELASMEHPFFALKGGDTKVREYKNGNITVAVKPNADGIATIFDKDVWIYAISKLQQAINQNEPISRTIVFTPYDFFLTTNRDKGGKSYKELEKALSRLAGTRIQTNINYSAEEKKTTGFGLIDSWEILEKKKGELDIGMVSVTLPDWLYQAITQVKVLKISPDYFRIRKAIDRRLYEIARKHCGFQHEFSITLDKLHQKVGSSALLKMFRHNIKQLAKANDLPDYSILYDSDTDTVTFENRSPNNTKAIESLKASKAKQGLKEVKKVLENATQKELELNFDKKEVKK